MLAVVAMPITIVQPSDQIDFALVELNGQAYFSGNDGVGGAELWKSDGADAGTTLVKEIQPGLFGSHPRELVNVNGALFFTAVDLVRGLALWKTDGTTSGTVVVKDQVAGQGTDQINRLTNFQDTLYFTAKGNATSGLWKSDGTTAGTVLVKELVIGEDSYPGELMNVNGTLYFAASDSGAGIELWKSDGTTEGTVRVKDLAPGSTSSFPRYLTNANGTLYFATAIDTFELWKSDGTVAGTTQIKIIPRPSALASAKANVFFTEAFTGQLWRSDGTAAGTEPVLQNVSAMTSIGEDLYFTAISYLYKTTATGELATIFTIPSGVGSPTEASGRLYFTSFDLARGQELWQSDGTQAGTGPAADLRPGPEGSLPRHLTNINGKLFFTAFDVANRHVLWSATDNGVNTAPFFTSGGDVSASYKAGPQTVPNWARQISAGAGGGGQALNFIVENDNPDLFAAQPAIDPQGTLTFAGKYLIEGGSAKVTVRLHDDGGNADGGIDTSAPVTFTIYIIGALRFNSQIPLDVDGDESIVAGDALHVINVINTLGGRDPIFSMSPFLPHDPFYFYDCTGDDVIAADDALMIINFINTFGPQISRQASEGESAAPQRTDAHDYADDDLLSLLALDQWHTANKKRSN